MTELNISATVHTPGGIEKTPFGDKQVGGFDSTVALTLHIDDATKAAIAAITSSAPAIHLSAAQLAAQYTAVELLAALKLT